MSDTCSECEELEAEVERCHNALNRSGVDPLLVESCRALESAALAFSDGDGDESGIQRLLDAACDFGAAWRKLNGEAAR